MAPPRGPAAPFDLPPRSVFEPPSYPNVWFYVHEALAESHAGAVAFVTNWLRGECGLVDDFGRYKPPEASDAQARLRGLQPWRQAADPARNHAHDLHIRYYYVALRQRGQERAGRYFRLAGSVHYEVEDEHPLHPYVDECPFCGRTGEYAGADDLFAGAHEPLGLELLLHGTNHGRRVVRADGRPAVGLTALAATHAVDIQRMRPSRPDMNIVDLAVVVIDPKIGGAPGHGG
ncbi:MAG TPA: hypothetical protein VKW09_02540 [bacterium]|nr:hypothetical protein [bacterium]